MARRSRSNSINGVNARPRESGVVGNNQTQVSVLRQENQQRKNARHTSVLFTRPVSRFQF